MNLLKTTLQSYNLKDLKGQKMCSSELFNNYGIKTQFNENYLILKYQRWNPNCQLENEILRYCRGTILSLDTLEPICYTFNMRKEYEIFSREINFSEISVYKYYDGTMINLFYDNIKNEWSFSTKGCLDASNSKWSSERNFKELFLEACTINYELLNKNHCYSFVLQHLENKIISNIVENRVILVLERDLTTCALVSPNSDIGTNIILPEQLQDFTSYVELEEYVTKLDFNDAGVILKSNIFHSRLMCSDYVTASQLKGNYKDKSKNIINLNPSQLEMYLYYYPDDTKIAENLEMLSRRLIASVFYLYTRTRIKKIYTKIPSHLGKFIYMIHQLYEQRLITMPKSKATITHQVIKGYFNSLNAYYKLELLNNHKEYLDA